MHRLCTRFVHGERYWFDDKDEAILAQGNREFEQTPPAIQLFYRYFKVAGDDKEGEYLSPVEILDYLQKRTTITLSSGKAHHFGRLLQKEGIPCKHTIKGLCIWWLRYKRGKSKSDNRKLYYFYCHSIVTLLSLSIVTLITLIINCLSCKSDK